MGPSRGAMGLVVLGSLVAGGTGLHLSAPASLGGRAGAPVSARGRAAAPGHDRASGRRRSPPGVRGAGRASDPGGGGSRSCQGAGTITVTGTGSATGMPDRLSMTLGVQTQSSSASAALARDNRETRALIGVLEQAGVASPHIQTTGLELNPAYDSSGNVTGYQASDQVTATLSHLEGAGTLIDDAASKVGNDITFSGLSFSVSNPVALGFVARQRAVRAAAEDAKAIASAAGVRLGPLCSATDDGASQSPPPIAPNLPAAVAARAAPAPVQPGQQSVSARVTLVYRTG